MRPFVLGQRHPHRRRLGRRIEPRGRRLLRRVDVQGRAGARRWETDAGSILRAGAQVTGARYLFLTDDPGVGGSHEAPHIRCVGVEHLARLVGRGLASELRGRRTATAAGAVLRSVGEPVNGPRGPDGAKSYLW